MTTEITSPVRRFQIIDLMIMTAAMALSLMMIKPYQSFYDDSPWLYSVLLYFQLLPIGIHFAAIIWLPWQRMRTGRFFIHPGHWILGGVALNSIGIAVFWLTAPALIGEPALIRDNNPFGNQNPVMLAFRYFIMSGFGWLSMIVMTCACFYHAARWRIAMVLLSLAFFCFSCVFLAYGVSMVEVRFFTTPSFYFNVAMFSEIGRQICMFLTAIPVCVAVVLDRRSRTKRDWLHWIGVTAILIQAILIPIPLLLSRFVPWE